MTAEIQVSNLLTSAKYLLYFFKGIHPQFDSESQPTV